MKRFTHLTLALGTVALLALLLILAVGAQPAARADGNTIKVPDDYPTIQAAIDAAAEGDTILVAADIYKENLSIDMGITLSGGWNISFTNRTPGMSVIDGQGLGRVISITCATSDTVVTVDGFTVQNGNANGMGGVPAAEGAAPELTRRGSAADPAQSLDVNDQMEQLSARLIDVVDKDLCPYSAAACQTVLDRVEEQIDQFASAQIEPALAEQNAQQAVDCGGGIYSWNAGLHLFNSTIQYNVASLDGDGSGGGVCVVQASPASAMLANNRFEENFATSAHSATGEGGGLYVLQAPGTVIEDNHFSLNTASNAGLLSSGIGGGMMLWASPDAIVEGNEVIRNTANAGTLSNYGLGGGVYVGQSDGVRVAENSIRENLAVVHGGCAGGGLMVNGSDGVVVADNEVAENVACFFQADMAGTGGGGMSLYGINAISVTGNLVRDNVAVVSGSHIGFSVGGGLDGENWFSASQIADNTFARNVANRTGKGWGGGVSIWGSHDVEVTDNRFVDNVGSAAKSSGAGGGLFLQNTMNGSVLRNHFQGNLAAREEWGDGGGMAAWQEGPKNFDLTIDANTFLDNQASADPTAESTGGACTFTGDGLTFTNNLIVGNKGNSGVYLPFSSRSSVVNNTLVGNQGAGVLISQGNRSPITLTNNIIVSHTVGISVTEGATATVRYTLWDGNGTDIGGGGAISHTHQVSGDPAFIDPSAHDYHLTIASAARDAGDPAGVPPAPDHDRDGVTRPQGVAVDIGAYEWQGYYQYLPLVAKTPYLRTGWAIGQDENNAAAIVHTADGGLTWAVQGGSTEWSGLSGNDISAVDDLTAWAALSSGPEAPNGVILHTTDGGVTWVSQTIPAGLTGGDGFKGIKGLSRDEAWATSYDGTVLHTIDGGDTWNIVPHPTVAITQVNRMDAMGSDVWIADAADGGAVVHTSDGGLTWQAEYLPCGDSPLTVHAFSPTDVWASGSILKHNPSFYRTVRGGYEWIKVKNVGALDHIDDVCAAGPDDVWGALNGEESSGFIWRVHIEPDGTPGGLVIAKNVTPPELGGFNAEGVTCLDARVAWVAAQNERHYPGLPLGIILHTTDGGESWVQASAPTDIEYWKISFVGARR